MNRCSALILVIFVITRIAGAAPSMSVDVGLGDTYRAGRWNPLYITLSNDTPRAVILEVRAAQSGNSALLVRQNLTIGPTPLTFPIYVPITQGLDALAVVLLEPNGWRRLAEWPADAGSTARSAAPQANNVLIGVSGRGATLRALVDRGGTELSVCVIPQARLPAVAQGYDALDVLILNQPDMNRLSLEQQTAIANWVRGGGNLVFWPGPNPVPDAGPLVQVLPARVGSNRTFEIAPERVRSAGLPARFTEIPGRELQPAPGAARVAMFGEADAPAAFRARVGFGHMLIVPIDLSLLAFDDHDYAIRFWRPLLAGMVDSRVLRTAQKQPGDQSIQWTTTAGTRRSAAMNAIMNVLGDVPGVGSFGIAYVAIVLIGLMLIVGPVDWLVLRALGRQPWTWFTTAGWITLVTTGAIFIGYAVRSGELHYRTLRLIDQADGAVVATMDVVGIYSPKTDAYEIATDPQSWWQPPGDGVGYGTRGLRTDLPFHQDFRGNRPLPMIINVWNLRFLEGEMLEPRPAMIEASLRWSDDGRMPTGTITNRSQYPLRDIVIRSGDVAYHIGGTVIDPGATANISSAARFDNRIFTPAQNETGPQLEQPNAALPQTTPYWSWFDLTGERAERINHMLGAADSLACIYATVENAPAAVPIANTGAIQKHWQVVRALVRITPSEDR